VTDVADLLAAPAAVAREAAAGPRLTAGLVAGMVSELRQRAADDLERLSGSGALAGVRAHFDAVAWQLLGSHVRDQGRIWQAARPSILGGPTINGAPFGSYMRDHGWTALLDRLPRLEPLVSSVARSEVEATATLLARAVRDREALAERFGDGVRPGTLIDVSLGLSDPHNRRSAVAALSFTGGARVLYKPRPVAMEHGLASTIDWLRSQTGLDLPAGATVLERDGYGWCEFVPRQPCERREDVGLYFRRLGTLAGVLAALAATDCHADNFIARGAEPILVDSETLLHPRLLASPGFSLRETEIVPSQVAGPAGQRIDYAGFDAAPTAAEPDPAGSPNLPRWDGRAHRLADHRPSFQAGVDLSRQALRDLGSELTGADGPLAAFAHRPARVVLRPTEMYGALLAHLASAGALGSDDGGWPRVEHELSRYRDPVLSRDVWDVVQRVEIAALARADVPYFLADTTTGDLHTVDGMVLASRAVEPVLTMLPAVIEQVVAGAPRRAEPAADPTS
jgi:lantibiotic modifying enzyme